MISVSLSGVGRVGVCGCVWVCVGVCVWVCVCGCVWVWVGESVLYIVFYSSNVNGTYP